MTETKKFFGNMEKDVAEDLVRNSRLESFEVTGTDTTMDLSTPPQEEESSSTSEQQQQQQQPPQHSKARPIPVPQNNHHHHPLNNHQAHHHQSSQSAASSQGSSGSAFLSSVLNPVAGIGGSSTQLLSHTPPFGSSYETKHFGKRARSGSVSGRLRSASEYLEERGLLDQQTKGILKDLIIIGDEELQEALDNYEAGDPSSLEEMIQSGALQNRLPQDLDILGDLDLDFLTMDETAMVGLGHADDNIEALPGHNDQEEYLPSQAKGLLSQGMIPLKQPPSLTSDQVAGAHNLQQLHQGQPNMVSPNYDDGIGDLEFAGDFVSDQTTDYNNSMHMQPHLYASKDAAAAHSAASDGESPVEENALSEYERRLRSNSLYSALLNEPRSKNGAVASAAAAAHGHYTRGASNATTTTAGNQQQGPQYGQWMDSYSGAGRRASDTNSNRKGGISIAKSKAKNRRSTYPSAASGGLAASLEVERKKREKEELKEQKKRERLEKKEKKLQEKKKAEESEEHVPGSGRPRSLSDPLLKFSIDEHGLQTCERPEGWVGAYSPSSRKVRIQRFLDKRNHRVWTKSVKYDVRKNFADSRLRVKGRFVKKEDEVLMRELMSLT